MSRPRKQEYHGTGGGYTNYHCRCDRCRSAIADAQRSYRRRKKEALMAHENHLRCGHCQEIAVVESHVVSPEGWIYVQGPKPFGRKDFCSWPCLIRFFGGSGSKLLDVVTASG